MITVGNKLNDISERYFNSGKKRVLVSELLKLVETLNSKRKNINFSKAKIKRKKNKKTKEILETELKKIRSEKKREKKSNRNNIVNFKIGDKVKKGQTIMIVEAMKTMNHVPSTADGEVKKILVEDGQPVEFGQTLILLK